MPEKNGLVEKEEKKKIATQVIGNIGLYYICYRLCRRGWNVMPTSRNARGIDIVIYSQDGKRTHTVQAKSLTERSPVPIGSNLENLFADYLIICRSVLEDKPEIFIVSIDKIKSQIHEGIRNNKVSYWLQPKKYEQYKDNWEEKGSGSHLSMPMKINLNDFPYHLLT
jgi:hypothetical protein